MMLNLTSDLVVAQQMVVRNYPEDSRQSVLRQRRDAPSDLAKDASLRMILDPIIRMRGVRPDGTLRGKVLLTIGEDGIWSMGITVVLLGAEVAFDGFHTDERKHWKDKIFLRFPFRVWPAITGEDEAEGSDHVVEHVGISVVSHAAKGGGTGVRGIEEDWSWSVQCHRSPDGDVYHSAEGWIFPLPSSPSTSPRSCGEEVNKGDLSASRRTSVALMANDLRNGIGELASTGDVLERVELAQTAGGSASIRSTSTVAGKKRASGPRIRQDEGVFVRVRYSDSNPGVPPLPHRADRPETEVYRRRARFLPARRTYSFPFEVLVPDLLQPSITHSEYVSLEYAVQAFVEPARPPISTLEIQAPSSTLPLEHVSPMYPLNVYGTSEGQSDVFSSPQEPARAAFRSPKFSVDVRLQSRYVRMGDTTVVEVTVTNRSKKAVKLSSVQLLQRVVLTETHEGEELSNVPVHSVPVHRLKEHIPVSSSVLAKQSFEADDCSIPPDACMKRQVRLRIGSSEEDPRIMPSVTANLFMLSHHVAVKVYRNVAKSVAVSVPVCLWDPSVEADSHTHTGRMVATIPSHFDMTDHEGDVYTVYCVHVHTHEEEWEMHRRYSEFYALHRELQKKCRGLPKLPPKRFWPQKSDATFLEKRRISLEDYLNALLRVEPILQSSVVQIFLGCN